MLATLEDRTVPTAVALLGADEPWFVDDVQAKLVGTGQFTSVTLVDVMSGTPTVAELETYDSVLVWNNYAFADHNALGDNLADYVDAGNGVVVATFANANTFYPSIGGRWASGGYDAISPSSYTGFNPLTLGAVAQPGHPIMAGVTAFDGGFASWHSDGAVSAGSALIASWSDGSPLVAERSNRDIGLNFFPPSSDAYFDGWNSGTDGALLMGNALSYVSGYSARAVSPANGAVVSTPPTDFVVSFSGAYDPTTVSATDLTVNGIAPASVALTTADTLTFHYAVSPVTAQGAQTIQMVAGAVAPLEGGDPVKELTATFQYDVLLMQVTSTDPAAGSVVQLPFTTLDLNFNEPYDPLSAKAEDFTVNQGTVTGVEPVDADTLRLSLAGITAEGTLTVAMPAGAMTDVYGNPGAAFSASYTLDFGTVPFPTPLKAEVPAGSLIYDETQAGVIDPAGDTDSFSILVDPGQKITVVVDPAAGLQPAVDVYRVDDGGNVLIGTATAGAAGAEAVLQTVAGHGQIGVMGPGPKTYLITVRGAAGTTGEYSVRMTLNAAVEGESHDGAANNTRATAQSLEPSFLPFASSVTGTPS
ncbi:MAG TPA: Ig-like domain-containing protein, partial [Gemmataceae bacterium]|nr:Ig-like domain-containing protein [Gemmataceae bacterium]